MDKKKVLIVGVGAQGTTIAKFIDKEPYVSEIICADQDERAVNELVAAITKGKPAIVDGTDTQAIIEVARGVDLVVNAMPFMIGKYVLDAALEVGANYQDFGAPAGFAEDFADSYDILMDTYPEKFKAKGATALCSTGAAPGLSCIVSRNNMKYLDTCDTIIMMIYEGIRTKKFQPFWWDPIAALRDMTWDPWACVNGEIVKEKPYSNPIRRTFEELGREEIFYEHAHDDPVYMRRNAEKYFGGAKNIYFKYSGAGIDFAKPLYELGLLSQEPEIINGVEVVPFDVISSKLPKAPKYPEEIKAIIDAGMDTEEGVFVVESYGKKDGVDVKVETHVFSPGLVESFERSQLTAEMYQTGQCGAIFTKMMLEGVIDEPGLISTDMMSFDQVDFFLKCAKEIGITIETRISNDY